MSAAPTRHGHRRPCAIGIERFHLSTQRRGPCSEIPLVHDPLLVDDEGPGAGHPVLRGKRDHREASGHAAVHHVVERASRRIRSLRRQYPEVIAMKWRRAGTGAATLVTLDPRLGHHGVEWTRRDAWR